MGRRDRRHRPNVGVVLAWALSLTAHTGVALWGAASLLDREVPPSPPLAAPAPPPEPTIAIELQPVDAPPAMALAPDPAEIAPSRAMGGGERLARPDAARAGRGGDPAVTLPAVNLAPRDDGAHLTRALRSRLERAQEARRRSGEGRRSLEDDTVTMRPTTLTFFADGEGRRPEPRPYADRAPTGGQWRAGRAQEVGAGPFRGPRDRLGDERPRVPAGNEDPGNSEVDAAGPGVYDGALAYAADAAADVTEARPMALRGRESTRGDERGPQSDDVDSEQEVMALERSLLAASTAGGRQGEGRGGSAGPGPTGSGGTHGPGSTAHPAGDGRGPGASFDPADARRRRYLRTIFARIQRAWSVDEFPRWAVLEGRGGTTIVSFVVQPDGRVTGVTTARGSGFPDFDEKMRAAVQRAAPFGPPPAELGAPFRHSHPFAVVNPAVRPLR
ncbi:MAG: energy transducer TonB [Polyangiaceae bacterium]